ncbi:MAG: phosphoglucosamine mutase [Clostridiales bacterium]|nr:phosphoglucosamine mutase [Clostridiales bacterium]
MRKLFGTDGVRGVANRELTSDLAFKLGQAAAYVLAGKLEHKPRIMVGTDTRISCDMLESALNAGLCSVGADVISLGVIPTPGVAYLTSKQKADAGVVISASHNSFEFNGIKFFDSEGYKLPDEMEAKIEEFVFSDVKLPHKTGANIGRIIKKNEYNMEYIEFLISQSETDLSGMKILLDCANGAAFISAPIVFAKLGAEITVINASPDGMNINDRCGSTHIDVLKGLVDKGDYDIGFAYDGDADRVIAVAENGLIIDGDRMLAVLALDMKDKGVLTDNTLVVTVMSNMGLVGMAKENGISIVKSKVGDRYVIEEMRKNGYSLGGEQSGHVIILDCNTTGDGILTSIKIAGIIAGNDKISSEIFGVMEEYPQVTVNAAVNNKNKSKILDDDTVKIMISAIENDFNGNGRLLIRPSGTEPVVRVMMEGRDYEYIKIKAKEMAELIEEKFGEEV